MILSVNLIDGSSATMWHFEPSSADTGNWVTSWHLIHTTLPGLPDDTHGFTSAWNGTWSSKVEHTPGGGHCIDTYLNFDSSRNRFVLVCLDWGGWSSVYYRYSTNSQGTSWGQWKLVLASAPSSNMRWDYPSIAVNSSSGRLVIGVSKLVNNVNVGYYTAVSTNGGDTWTGSYRIGTLSGEISRLVWSQTGFHAFILNRSDPNDFRLYRYGSSDGVTWSAPQLVNNYRAPLKVSPGKYCPSCPIPDRPCDCSGTNCGGIAYAAEPDAVGASSGLGWVVAYPANNTVTGLNGINVQTEFGGGVTITHVTDLFFHGITTSSAGDWWLSYHTFSDTTTPNRWLPLKVGVVYRTAGSPTYLGKILTDTVRPNKGWFWWDRPQRCASISCFIAGDYTRPASNTVTGSSIPWIRNSTSGKTDLMQAFLQDPQAVGSADFLPTIEPIALGADLRDRGVMTPDHWEQWKWTGEPVMSSLAYAAVQAARRAP